jgi:hypothetical protein
MKEERENNEGNIAMSPLFRFGVLGGERGRKQKTRSSHVQNLHFLL